MTGVLRESIQPTRSIDGGGQCRGFRCLFCCGSGGKPRVASATRVAFNIVFCARKLGHVCCFLCTAREPHSSCSLAAEGQIPSCQNQDHANSEKCGHRGRRALRKNLLGVLQTRRGRDMFFLAAASSVHARQFLNVVFFSLPRACASIF